MQSAFHELAHASLFRQVGDIYWEEVISNIIITNNSSCGNYGCGTEFGAGKASLNEAWAEYLGKEHHRRLHPHLTAQAVDDNGNWRSYPDALEGVTSFRQLWIPTGVFFDLRDNQNLTTEPNDLVQGISIAEMYSVFSPNTGNFCEYRDRFVEFFPNVTRDQFNGVFVQNGFLNCAD